MQFSKTYIANAVQALGFTDFTDVQRAVIPDAIRGRDIVACSQTGSGKTHAFLIPIFSRLVEREHRVQAVIVSPTRELASQLLDAARQIAAHAEEPIDIRLYSGGQDRHQEIERLKKSQPMIVIGTPGKIKDLAINANVLKIHRAETIVIDEADMALDIGFLPDIESIVSTTKNDAQLMVFSATIPESLKPFLRRSTRHAKEVSLEDKSLGSLAIDHRFFRVDTPAEKDKRLMAFTRETSPYLALVFVNQKADADRLATMLYQAGKQAIALHGDVPARKRKQLLRRIHNLDVQYVVATDMASRGLDIEGISHIINYDLPVDMNFYVHRVGRTARMGHSGTAISYFTDRDGHVFHYMEKHRIAYTVKGTKPKNAPQDKRRMKR